MDYQNRYITEDEVYADVNGTETRIERIYYTKDGKKAKIRQVTKYINGILDNRKRYRERGGLIEEIDRSTGKNYKF